MYLITDTNYKFDCSCCNIISFSSMVSEDYSETIKLRIPSCCTFMINVYYFYRYQLLKQLYSIQGGFTAKYS